MDANIGLAIGAITAIIGIYTAITANKTYRSKARVLEAEWTTKLIKEFLLSENTRVTRVNLENYFYENLSNYIQACIGDLNTLDFCKEEELFFGLNLEEFLIELNHFCYLEKRELITQDSFNASLKYWIQLLARPDFFALRVFLEKFGYRDIVAYMKEHLALREEDFVVSRLAVYGTLRSNSDGFKELRLSEVCESESNSEIQGRVTKLKSGYLVAHFKVGNHNLSSYEKEAARFEVEVLHFNSSELLEDKIGEIDHYENDDLEDSPYRRYLLLLNGKLVWIYGLNDSKSKRRPELQQWINGKI